MADTHRTEAAILALFADNTSGAISAQDLRDAVVSLSNEHGEIYVSSSALTSIATVNVWYEASGTYALTTSPAAHQFDMATNARLRYTGASTRVFHVAGSFSVTSASNNKVTEVAIGKNGTPNTPSIMRTKLAVGADVQAGALHGFIELTTNDYLSIMVRDTTDDTDVTLVLANLFAMGMIS